MKIDLTLTTVTLCITLLHFGQDASCVPDDSGAFAGPMCKSNIIPYHFDYGRNSLAKFQYMCISYLYRYFSSS